jgi:hypothetical protein
MRGSLKSAQWDSNCVCANGRRPVLVIDVAEVLQDDTCPAGARAKLMVDAGLKARREMRKLEKQQKKEEAAVDNPKRLPKSGAANTRDKPKRLPKSRADKKRG